MSRSPRRRSPPTAEELSPAGPYRSLKEAGLLLLLVAWTLLGVLGHDPWKTEDATAFGVAWDMMRSGDYLAPTLAGEPYLARPPLIYLLAALSGKLLAGVAAVHDAARVAASALLGLTLLLLTFAGIELNGRGTRWLPALLFIGCVGLWDRAHQLSPELGLVVGVAGALYGMALALRRPVAGGVATGLAAGIAFLAHGFAGPVWILVALFALPLAFARFRSKQHGIAAATAIAVALAVSVSWPLALALHAPDHLRQWWSAQTPSAFISSLAGDPLFLAKNLPWFAWPVLPLALWSLWTRGRGFSGGLAIPAIAVPATMTGVIAVALTLAPESRAIMAMPLLCPLCLVAALEIDTLKRGYSAALDWFGILTFGLLAVLLWGLWIDAYLHGMSPLVARLFRDTEAGYRPPATVIALGVAVFLTALWLALVRPARRSNRRAALNWAAGTTLLWGLYMTIWLPYLDLRRSYRPVALSLASHLPDQGCVASRQLGEPQRALFSYFAGLSTLREETRPDPRCAALLVQYGGSASESAAQEGWTAVWTGRRRGDDSEYFVLYQRVAP
jgi:4-amino-4-deoxy-L-arabinose transferase-like glycosyltransferase